jgi:RNA polymerase sigma-70 factor (ECF subfamily)
LARFRFIIAAVSRDSRPVQRVLSEPEPRATDHDRALTRARAGDGDALDLLVRAELPRVARLLTRILGPRADLSDLVQVVFLELCRALPSFRGDSSFSTFVGGITVRVARRAMRPTAWWSRQRPLPETLSDDHISPERSAELAEGVRRCQRALEKLSPDKRVAFSLWAFEELDVAQISELTGASISATRSRIFYAQKELRKRAENDPWLSELFGGSDERE